MDLLVDTNVLLDLLLDREGSDTVKDLFRTIDERHDRGFITASSVTDIFYIVRKSTGDNNKAYEALNLILQIVSILPVTEADIKGAYNAHWNDFEDCVQYQSAIHRQCGAIITNNIKDFPDTEINIMTPQMYIESID